MEIPNTNWTPNNKEERIKEAEEFLDEVRKQLPRLRPSGREALAPYLAPGVEVIAVGGVEASPGDPPNQVSERELSLKGESFEILAKQAFLEIRDVLKSEGVSF